MQAHDGWYPLLRDGDFPGKAKRSSRRDSRYSRFRDSESVSNGQDKWYRKLFSIRFIFCLIVFLEV